MLQISWTNHQVSSAIASKSLSLIWQSEIVLIKTELASIKILKVLGINLFLTAATSDILQYWMTVILVHCGGRRSKVRVQALDFLELILRLHWDSFGVMWGSHYLQLWQKSWSTLWQQQQPNIVEHKCVKMYLVVYSIYQTLRQKVALTPLWRTLKCVHNIDVPPRVNWHTVKTLFLQNEHDYLLKNFFCEKKTLWKCKS